MIPLPDATLCKADIAVQCQCSSEAITSPAIPESGWIGAVLVGYFDGDIFAVEAAFIGVMDLLGHEPVKRCRHFGGDPVGADPQGGEGIVGRGLRQCRGRVEENQSQCQRPGRFFAGERRGEAWG